MKLLLISLLITSLVGYSFASNDVEFKFNQLVYKTIYVAEPYGYPSLNPVTIEAPEGSTVTLGGDFSDFFTYDYDEKTVKVRLGLQEVTLNTTSYIALELHAELDSNTAEAVLIVALPYILRFGKIYYETDYRIDGETHDINWVEVGTANAATVSLEGEYAQYFDIMPNRYIRLTKNLPDDVISSMKHITVTIRATVNYFPWVSTRSITTILIVNMPPKSCV